MQLADLSLRQGRDARAVEGQLLVERRDIRLVAAQAVQRLAEDQVDAAAGRVVQKALEAGAVERGAGDRHVSEGLHHRPALALGALHAEPHLVLDGGRASAWPTSTGRRWRRAWGESLEADAGSLSRNLRRDQTGNITFGRSGLRAALDARGR